MSGYVHGQAAHRESGAAILHRLAQTTTALAQARTELRHVTTQRDQLAARIEKARTARLERARLRDTDRPDPDAPPVDYSADACWQRLVAATAEADRWHMTKETL